MKIDNGHWIVKVDGIIHICKLEDRIVYFPDGKFGTPLQTIYDMKDRFLWLKKIKPEELLVEIIV